MTNTPTQSNQEESTQDAALGFALPELNARGRLVRLNSSLQMILGNYDYPPQVKQILGEALVLVGLIGSMLKEASGQVTLQAQTQNQNAADNSAISLLVVDYLDGELRGYAQYDQEMLASLPDNPRLENLFGAGYLAITIDNAHNKTRYQGIVELKGASLGAAAEAYFAQSEQVPTMVRIAVDEAEGGGLATAGGLLLQYLPEGEEARLQHEKLQLEPSNEQNNFHPHWERVLALGQTISRAELLDSRLGFELLLWRLFNEDEIIVLPQISLSKGCRCSVAYYQGVLAKFPKEELQAMTDDQGIIQVDCAFCAKQLPVQINF